MRCMAFQAIPFLNGRVHYPACIVLVVAFVAERRYVIGQRKCFATFLWMSLPVAGVAFVTTALQSIVHYFLFYQIAVTRYARTASFACIYLPACIEENSGEER